MTQGSHSSPVELVLYVSQNSNSAIAQSLMPTFLVVGVPGNGSGTSFMGFGRVKLEIRATSRAMAYVDAYRLWESQGFDVAARAMGAHRSGRDNYPLGFSKEELQEIGVTGTPIRSDFPNGGGIQIEEINEVSTEAA